MTTESGLKIWDSRFSDDHVTAPLTVTGSRSRASAEAGDLLQDVMMVPNGLPYIPHEFLRHDSHLGKGTSFEVSKEVYRNLSGDQPHFVAVKRLVMRSETGTSEESARAIMAESRRRLVNVKREVRVLTHPKLRSHPCLVSAIGWGLTPNTGGSNRPYLVMSYSMIGTLARFSQKRSLNLVERRFLALDVAMGIRALHDCNIVHGDVKPDNVLVYEYGTRIEEHEPYYLAKVADFGSALFQEDFAHQQAFYLGTPMYNAPEIRGLQRNEDTEEEGEELKLLFNRFKAADCYSFGLLLWETVNLGKSFIESENSVDVLDSMFKTKENAILEMATNFFQDWQANFAVREKEESVSRIGVYPSNPTRLEMQSLLEYRRSHLDPIDAPSDEDSLQAFKATVSLCLQDRIRDRGNIHQIVEALAKGVRDILPPGGSSTLKVLPRERRLDNSSPYLDVGYETIRQITPDESPNPFSRLLRLKKVSENLRVVPMDTPADPSLQVARLAPVKHVETLVLTPQAHCYGQVDMFRAALNRQPPWETQRAAFDFLQHAIQKEKDEERRAQAHLQLAIMHQIGYGVADDSSKALVHLESAAEHNQVARAILERVRLALDPDDDQDEQEPAHITYRNPDMFLDGVIERSGKADEEFLTLGPIKSQSFNVFSRLVKKGKYEFPQLADAFVDACRDGHLDAAMLLAQYCQDIYTVRSAKPNMLHWLIMFGPAEAVKVLKTLVSSPSELYRSHHLNVIRSLLNAEHDVTVLLPHRCLELRGTPLHWAVMAGYEDLVEEFLRLGADVNRRTKSRRTQQQDGYQKHHPSLSPLDVAAASHFPQIVELLLDHGSEVYGGDFHWSFSPFHMLGERTFPFARYMYHGRRHRDALRDTIRILRDRGLDINGLDSQSQTPIFLALRNMDLEPYILEELLSAGARPGAEDEEREGNVVISAVTCCRSRRFSAWKIPLLLPLVRDINGCTADLNALHYCAFFDAAPAAEVLLRCPGIDIGAVSASSALTAMSLAGQRGSLEVLALLIENGADINKGDAMSSAICFGHIDAVRLLLEKGPDIHYWHGKYVTNILSSAVRRNSTRPSYVKKCLALCPQLCEQQVLDDQDDNGWTALHWAAYFGDVEGVRALFEAGADTRIVSGVDETPIELAALTLKEFTAPDSRASVRQTHPRIEKDLHALDGGAIDYHARVRELEMGLQDSLYEVIQQLREAEREQYPGVFDPQRERRIVREPRLGELPEDLELRLSRDELLARMYNDVKS